VSWTMQPRNFPFLALNTHFLGLSFRLALRKFVNVSYLICGPLVWYFPQ
jgi:hypothetical protein